MKRLTFVILSLLGLTMVACAPGANDLVKSPNTEGDVAGFWLGLWHGIIVLFTFIISIFKDTVHIYEVHNSGTMYNLGYLLGVMMFFGGGGASRRSCR